MKCMLSYITMLVGVKLCYDKNGERPQWLIIDYIYISIQVVFHIYVSKSLSLEVAVLRDNESCRNLIERSRSLGVCPGRVHWDPSPFFSLSFCLLSTWSEQPSSTTFSLLGNSAWGTWAQWSQVTMDWNLWNPQPI